MATKKKQLIGKILIYQWIWTTLLISGCEFKATNPNNLRLVFEKHSVFIEDFENKTFSPNVAEYARLSMIEKIRRSPNLTYSNHLNTELLLTVIVTGASQSSSLSNQNENAYRFKYTIIARVQAVVNNEVFAEKVVYDVKGTAVFEKVGSVLESSELRTLSLKAAEDLAENLFEAITLKF